MRALQTKTMLQLFNCTAIFHFSGARIEDMNQYIIPTIKKQPDYLILHVGTNDATTNTSKKIVDDLLTLESNISKQLPS